MAKETISSQTLKVLRKQAKLSQQKLADISRVSKPTIARIEGGKSFANTTTINRLATALGVKPEDLSNNPKDMDSPEKKLRVMGYEILKRAVQENTVISFHMVEQRYGFSVTQLISLAPLFAALLAEGSLAWRKKKMEQAEQAIEDLYAADTGHMGFVVAAGAAEDGGYAEQVSIEQRDIFGKVTFEDEFRRGYDWADPFSCYLQHLAKDIGSQFIDVIPHDDSWGRYEDREYFQNWTTDVNLGDHGGLEYHLDAMELERLTGGDLWAKKALSRSHVTVADIPEELKSDEAEAERVAWLVKHVPQSEIDEQNAFYAQFKINRSNKEDGSSKKEHSNDR